MRKSLLVLFACVVALGCQRNEPAPAQSSRVFTKVIPGDASNARVNTVIQPAPVFLDRSLLGTDVGADGNVTADAVTAAAGKPVYLTMFLHESPVGLKTQVKWFDAAKKVIHHEERDMKGGKVVTFAFDTKKLKPGTYKAEGFWGGNLAAEKDFEVTKAKK